jgi:DNA-binding response OmpR family regulator
VEASEVSPPSALVVAADEEMRILLRGLLQLHRVRVEAEAEGVMEALRLMRERRPNLVVVDTHLSDGNSNDLLVGAKALVPAPRVILVASASRPPPVFPKGGGPDVLLLKPFRIQQFAEAIALPRGPDGSPAPP